MGTGGHLRILKQGVLVRAGHKATFRTLVAARVTWNGKGLRNQKKPVSGPSTS